MASSVIGQLRILLGLETAQLESGARKAKTELRGIGDVAKEVRGLVNTMFAAFAVTALAEVVKTSLEHVEALAKQAKALGTTTQALQEMRYAAGQAGVSTEIFDKAMFKLSKSLGDARNGAEAPKKAFAELSKIIGHDITAGTGDALKILPEFSEALTKLADPTRRNSIEAHLLGKAYGDMAPFLALGAEKINALRKSAEDLGIVLSDSQIQGAEETAHKLKSLHDILGARIDGAVASNAKAILGFADAITHVALALAKFWGQNPKLAMGLVGAAAGASLGRVGGIYGAAAGGVGGFLLGEHIAGDTPESLRSQAYKYRTAAQMQGRALGYYGASSAKQKVIISAPGVGGNLQKYHQLLAQADALERSQALGAGADQPGTETPGQFLAGKGHHGHDRSSEIARDNENKQFEIAKQALDGQKELLSAQLALTYGVRERGKIAVEQIEDDYKERQLEIQHRLDQVLLDKNATDATKVAAKAQAAKATILNDQLHTLKLQAEKDQEEYDLTQERISERKAEAASLAELQQLQASMAKTAAERRDVELKILDHKYDELRREQQDIIDDPRASLSQKIAAGRALYNIDRMEPLARKQVLESTAGPLEQLSQSIPDTAKRMNEALQQVAAQGLTSLNDGLAEASASFIKLGGTAGTILRQLYVDVMKLLMARYLEKPAANFLGKLLGSAQGIGGGGGGGGDLDALISDIPAFAGGGSLMIGGMGGVDANLLSINGMPAARVNQGERLDIVPANDTGTGRGAYYDMRGAFLTKELFDYIDTGDVGATVHGASGGTAGAMSSIRRAAARQLPTGGRR